MAATVPKAGNKNGQEGGNHHGGQHSAGRFFRPDVRTAQRARLPLQTFVERQRTDRPHRRTAHRNRSVITVAAHER